MCGGPHVAGTWRSAAAASLCALTGEGDPTAAICGLVNGLLAEAGVDGPRPPLELLASLRRVRRIEEREMAEDGRLVPEGEGYVIHVHNRRGEEKKRFTVGHETCHTFFNEASARPTGTRDHGSGAFDIRQEEEYLCDAGAARMLLHPAWLVPLARSQPPSLARLFEIAGLCGASAESTAFQLAAQHLWDRTFVFWEPGYRREERAALRQPRLHGWETIAGPEEKLRVQRVYGCRDRPFIPRNKSADPRTLAHRCLADQIATEGDDELDLGRQTIRAFIQSQYAPYHDAAGALRPRVISCILWGRSPDGERMTTRQTALLGGNSR